MTRLVLSSLNKSLTNIITEVKRDNFLCGEKEMIPLQYRHLKNTPIGETAGAHPGPKALEGAGWVDQATNTLDHRQQVGDNLHREAGRQPPQRRPGEFTSLRPGNFFTQVD